jgi:hypothetical protein
MAVYPVPVLSTPFTYTMALALLVMAMQVTTQFVFGVIVVWVDT